MRETPRVRFAPSPTGELHIGNARTALFNFLFARNGGGAFVLRIEDTDRVRTSEAFEKGIIGELKWLLIDWDEGPEKDGAYGPYHQYQRLDLYKAYLERLIETGRVYPCYCTEEELEIERASLISRGLPPRYLGKCRRLTQQDRERLATEGKSPSYRFSVSEGEIAFDDLIRGPMRFNRSAIGDFIVVRSNGIPAYNFAVVIDDHQMKISHVIRGEDHLSNTAVQLLLYEAFGFSPPRFAHHSLILGKDRSKLSKRHGSVSVREFREKGFLPEALLNYLSLLGSSFSDAKEICTLEEMIRDFSLERAGRSGAIFDEDKLRWLNAVYIRNEDPERLAERSADFIRAAGFDPGSPCRKRMIEIIRAVQPNLITLADIGHEMAPFYAETFRINPEAETLLRSDEGRRVLSAFYNILAAEDPSAEISYHSALDKVRLDSGAKGKALYLPVRAALTGRLKGPELDKIYGLLGYEEILNRLKSALDT